MKSYEILLQYGLAVLVIISLAVFFTDYIVAFISVKITQRKNEITPSYYDLPYKDFSAITTDNIKIHGWIIENQEAKGTILLCHNLNANRQKLLEYAVFLYKSGFNIVMLDFRSHGDSSSGGTMIMNKIHLDVLAVLDYLKKETVLLEKGLGLMGFSLGSVACLKITCVCKEVNAVVLDSSVGHDINKVFIKYYERVVKLRIPFKSLVWRQMKFIAGARKKDFTAIYESLKTMYTPILFIHGERDTFVDYKDTMKLFDVCSSKDKDYMLVQGSHHLTNYMIARERYIEHVTGFFLKFL